VREGVSGGEEFDPREKEGNFPCGGFRREGPSTLPKREGECRERGTTVGGVFSKLLPEGPLNNRRKEIGGRSP